MLRKQLRAAIEKAARQSGYEFFQGFPYRMNSITVRFPALWLVPPKMTRIDGRREGEARYRVEMHLMHLNRKFTETDKEQRWETMERDALRIINRIGPEEGIFCTAAISLTPSEFTLTAHGELSLKAEFDATLYFDTEP